MIQHKIRIVPDSVCKGCLQHWEGECRAYCLPHSEAERLSRKMEWPYRFPCEGYVPPEPEPQIGRFEYLTVAMLMVGLIVVLVCLMVT